jgi:chromosome segregation ATPase
MEITENRLKEILSEQRSEFQHFMGIMKEDTDSKFQLIIEQFQGIQNTLNSHTETLTSHTGKLNSHTETLNSHTEKLNSHNQMLGALMEDVSIIKSDVQFLKMELKRKVDYDEFNTLVKRVSLLEAKARR